MIIYPGATLIGLYPRWFNYPVKITRENAAREYRVAANMLRVVKAEVVVCMLIIEWVFINISMGEDMTLSPPFMILFLGLLALTVLYFIYEMHGRNSRVLPGVRKKGTPACRSCARVIHASPFYRCLTIATSIVTMINKARTR
jgi:hypothetical protein